MSLICANSAYARSGVGIFRSRADVCRVRPPTTSYWLCLESCELCFANELSLPILHRSRMVGACRFRDDIDEDNWSFGFFWSV